MSLEPPSFQEAARCDVCKCSFNTFRRRHHCRCCGRTLCHEHSASQMALPQFGIYSNVRVCADCFNGSSRSGIVGPQSSSDGVDVITDEVSRLDIGTEVHARAETTVQHNPSSALVIECKCGMPLCICEAPVTTADPPPPQTRIPSTSQPNPKPRRTDGIPKNRGSTSNSKPSSVFNHSQMTSDTVDKYKKDYEVNGEGLREAIKNDDIVAVRKLLSEGVDANYRDRQAMSLLHLAALFNRTEIAFTLMESGASLDYKNAQGETPLDCAPATLQYKMKNKMEEGG
ncbi:hypothetical protein K2173_016029 [Erythroxylum novogranatense]|uniref:FYVE-type domain-containing protein n=1 Tax=Erythroxylum novogranatense TaxID=1862640 RepID=A0AAV8SFM0_9ROSI|nr:hypothetical protein K2173_016029 [Erythroxylum novogranatense]